MPAVAFRGWPAAAVEFFAGLEVDNSKAYWTEHRATYEDDVKAPFLALSEEVEDEFGPLRLFRPYRDVRFAKDKRPYKTEAGALTEGEGGTFFYVALRASGLYVGAGYYRLESDQLDRYRRAVGEEATGGALVDAMAAVASAGLTIETFDQLKRAPPGWPADHPRIDLLRRKGLHVSRAFAPARWLSTAGARDRIVGTWRAAAPVCEWLDAHVGPSELAPAED